MMMGAPRVQLGLFVALAAMFGSGCGCAMPKPRNSMLISRTHAQDYVAGPHYDRLSMFQEFAAVFEPVVAAGNAKVLVEDEPTRYAVRFDQITDPNLKHMSSGEWHVCMLENSDGTLDITEWWYAPEDLDVTSVPETDLRIGLIGFGLVYHDHGGVEVYDGIADTTTVLPARTHPDR